MVNKNSHEDMAKKPKKFMQNGSNGKTAEALWARTHTPKKDIITRGKL